MVIKFLHNNGTFPQEKTFSHSVLKPARPYIYTIWLVYEVLLVIVLFYTSIIMISDQILLVVWRLFSSRNVQPFILI